jgi:hypothetical protein
MGRGWGSWRVDHRSLCAAKYLLVALCVEIAHSHGHMQGMLAGNKIPGERDRTYHHGSIYEDFAMDEMKQPSRCSWDGEP